MAKKKRKVSKKNNIRKKKAILYAVIGLVLLAVIVFIIISSFNKKLVCTKSVSKDGVTEKNVIIFKLKGNKIKNINVQRTFIINKDSKYYGYLSVIKSSLSTAYKNANTNYKLKSSKNKVLFELTYNKEKSYILNGTIVSLSDGVVSITTVSQDLNNAYFTVDLGKNYTLNDIKKIALKQNYRCQ